MPPFLPPCSPWISHIHPLEKKLFSFKVKIILAAYPIYDEINNAFFKIKNFSQPSGKDLEHFDDRYLKLSTYKSTASGAMTRKRLMNNDHGLPGGKENKQYNNLVLHSINLSYSKVSWLKKGWLGSLL